MLLILSIADCQTVVFQWPASGHLSTLILAYTWSSSAIGIKTLFFAFSTVKED